MTKQIVVIATAVMTTLLALLALWEFRIVALCVFISLVLAATVRGPMPPSESRKSVTTRLRLFLQFTVALVVAGILIFLVGRFLVGDFQQLAERFARQNIWSVPVWLEGSSIQQWLVKWLPTPDKLFSAITGQRQFVFSAALGITQSIGNMISVFLVILFLSVYWSLNQNHFERLWLSLLPAEQRRDARYIWRTIEYDLGAYVRSEIIQSTVAVVLLGLGYSLLGSPYPALLAVMGALAWLVPVVGAFLALVLPFLLGLFSGIQMSILTVLYTLVVLVALQMWLEPRLFKLKLDNPVLTFVILLAMADAFGLLGIIAAPMVSVICQTLWRLLVGERVASSTEGQAMDLRKQKERLQMALDEMNESLPPLVASSMERLNDLFEKAEPILQSVQESEAPDIFRTP
jgi:predicted PurR-regulated permease PerM